MSTMRNLRINCSKSGEWLVTTLWFTSVIRELNASSANHRRYNRKMMLQPGEDSDTSCVTVMLKSVLIITFNFTDPT